MAEIEVFKENATHLRVFCEFDSDTQTLYEHFKFRDPTYSPHARSRWDGMVRLYNKKNNALPVGLLPALMMFAKEYGLGIKLDDSLKPIVQDVDREDLKAWIDSLNLSRWDRDLGKHVPLEIYDFQFEAIYNAIRFGRVTILAATSGGKSLIAYLLIRMYEEMGLLDEGKILITVPSTLLVTQMFENFEEYSQFNGWDANVYVHTIHDGGYKHSNKPVFVSTWQGIQDEDKTYFAQFVGLITDEVHLASAKKLTYIADSCVNAHQRVGMTGTLKNVTIHTLQVQGLFGPIKRVVSAKELQDAGRAAKTNIMFLTLKYSPEDRRELASVKRKKKTEDDKRNPYQREIDYLVEHSGRNQFIMNMGRTLKGNTLMLFDRKDAHLMVIAERMRQELDKDVYVITGDVKGSERDTIKRLIEEENDVLLLATYGTMSTGVSINKLHNLVFCHPSKSIVRILQSLGRLMRLHSSKETANIIDLVDDLRLPGQDPNYAVDHAMERFGYYKDERHPIKKKVVSLAA